MLHVAQISFFLDPERRTPAQIIRDWWPLVDCAEAVSSAGARVTVIQACDSNSTLAHNGVEYHFIRPETHHPGIAAGAAFGALIRDLGADVFHVHGLICPDDVVRLGQCAPEKPILVQDHAARLPRLWRRSGMRRGLRAAAGVSFCARDQALPFLKAGIVSSTTTVFEIPECSSRFTPGDHAEARRLTGLHGDPAILWVGHLDANKDPLSVLRGVRQALYALPDLELWCCYGKAPLLDEVRGLLAREPGLARRVHLLGTVGHGEVERLMRAADLFVAGSHREGSGCALIEALACGLPPVVTDIPSFRALTAGGTVGRLWPCGDSGGLARALAEAARLRQRSEVRAHFNRELSPAAVGAKLVQAYRTLINSRLSRANPESPVGT